MPYAVKITRDNDGIKVENPKWHYVHEICGSSATLCSGEYFGSGESNAEYDTKDGKITCPDCIAIIKEIKNIKL